MTLDPLASSGDVLDGPAADPGTDAATLMLLRLGDRCLAIDVHAVSEVALKGAITRVPTAPNHILGITSLRGRLVTVIGIDEMLGGGCRPSREIPATLPRLVVVRHGDYEIALVAEAIHGIGQHMVGPRLDEGAAPALPDFVQGEFEWQEERVALLDVPRLISAAATLSGILSTSEGAEA
jgi:purine-binding chemotaxis protein CheW